MAQDLLFPGNILSLHRAAVDKLARQGDGDAALLYLVLAAGGTAGALPWGPEKVEGAKNTLIQLGLPPSDAAVLPPSPRSWRTTARRSTPPRTSPRPSRTGRASGTWSLRWSSLLGKVLSPLT